MCKTKKTKGGNIWLDLLQVPAVPNCVTMLPKLFDHPINKPTGSFKPADDTVVCYMKMSHYTVGSAM